MVKPSPQRKLRSRTSSTLAVLSGIAWLFLLAVYLSRPLWAAALGIIPIWAWTIMGLAIAGIIFWITPQEQHRLRRSAGLLALAWMGFTLLLAEEPRSLLHRVPTPTDRPPNTLRVVSLNCGGGSAAAAREIIGWNPDIVLLQEAPSEEALREVAAALWTNSPVIIREFDTAILARSPGEPIPQQGNNRKTVCRGRITLGSTTSVAVASLHLMVPPIDLNVLHPATWTTHRDSRLLQSEQLHEAIGDLLAATNAAPTIIAGDFNAPQRDWIFKAMEVRLRDAFRDVGAGWGNTVDNDYAVLRIDQIWVSHHFRVRAAWAVKTQNSDHRMVIADISIINGSD